MKDNHKHLFVINGIVKSYNKKSSTVETSFGKIIVDNPKFVGRRKPKAGHDVEVHFLLNKKTQQIKILIDSVILEPLNDKEIHEIIYLQGDG